MQVKNGLARQEKDVAAAQDKEGMYERKEEVPILGIYADRIFAGICFRYALDSGISKSSNKGKESKKYLRCQAGNFQTVNEEGQQIPVKNRDSAEGGKKQKGNIPLRQAVGRFRFFAGGHDGKKSRDSQSDSPRD